MTAAKKLGVRGFGFDIDPQRIAESNENAKKNGVESLVKFERKNIFDVDLSPGGDALSPARAQREAHSAARS